MHAQRTELQWLTHSWDLEWFLLVFDCHVPQNAVQLDNLRSEEVSMRLNALYRPAIRLSLLGRTSPYPKGDIAFKARFCGPLYLLIISALLIQFFPNSAKAQKTNELCFEELVANFLVSDPRKYSGVKGFRTAGLASQLDSVADAPFYLRIDPPLVNYENLKGPYFAREVSADVVFVDSTDHLSTLTWRDTLHRRDLSAVRKTDHPVLKGTDPRWRSKVLAPAVLIGAGIAGIISLFYIRSA